MEEFLTDYEEFRDGAPAHKPFFVRAAHIRDAMDKAREHYGLKGGRVDMAAGYVTFGPRGGRTDALLSVTEVRFLKASYVERMREEAA